MRKTFAIMVGLTLLFALGGWDAGFVKAVKAEPGNLNAKRCSAAQGQHLINEGRYSAAIREFTKDFYDSIMVQLAPDGTPVVGSDDANSSFAAFEWTAEVTSTYELRVTSFESVNTGALVVTRN